MKITVAMLLLLVAGNAPVALARPGAASGQGRVFELRGDWAVGALVDPGRHRLPADVAAQLAAYRLPMPGQMIRGAPGRFCAGTIPCDAVTWTAAALRSSPGGVRSMQDFGVAGETRVYAGETGNRWIGYTVLARPDGSLAAVVGLCQDSAHVRDCFNVLEPWRPAGPGAAMAPVGRRR